MKEQLLIFCRILIIPFSLLFSACSPVFYAPNTHNVPLFKEKHETRISLARNSDSDYLLSSWDVQAAYAVGENIGVIANGTFVKCGGAPYSSSWGAWSGNGSLVEAGAGYFKPIGKSFVMEIYGGAGAAGITSESRKSPYNSHHVKFTKYFIQPAFGFNSNGFEIALSPKVACIHYQDPLGVQHTPFKDANGQYVYDQNGDMELVVSKEKQTFFAIEPCLTIGGGWKYLKLRFQYVLSYQEIPHNEFANCNFGLSLNLAPRFSKTTK